MGWSSLAVGLAVALIGYLTLQRGRKNLTSDALAPSRSAEQLRKGGVARRDNGWRLANVRIG